MTFHRGVLLGLIALCAALQNTEALYEYIGEEEANYDFSSLTSRGRQSNNGSTPIGNVDELEATTLNFNSSPHRPLQQEFRSNSSAETSPSAPLEEERIVRIIVLGRREAGVSSTVNELIGPNTKCEKLNDGGGAESLDQIYEYTLSNIPGTASHVKLIDIPGFQNDHTSNSKILATLKSYLGKVGDPPDFFVAISRFDEHLKGIHSSFVKFLKKMDLFKTEFLGRLSSKKMNIIFLLTRLMSETKAIQRRPNRKIATFKGLIQNFTSFPGPYQIIVGNNRAHSDYDAPVKEGYYQLPNAQLYPKNVWDAMINSTEGSKDHQGDDLDPTLDSKIRSVLTAIRNSREVKLRCDAKLISMQWEEYNEDAAAFLYLLQQQNMGIEQNDVNLKVQEVYRNLPLVPDKVNGVIQKTALQLFLQNENITRAPTDFPTGYSERAAFFQRSTLVSSSFGVLLLNRSFGLEMPEYIQTLTVGYGYDIMADELSLETPFKAVENLPSPVGYRFPSFMNCKMLAQVGVKGFRSYSENITEYFRERLNHLHFADMKEEERNINLDKFTGRAKAGYNMALEEGVEIGTLTAAKEVRTLECVLAQNDSWGELNEEFVEIVDALEPVDLYKRDSVTDWQIFFSKYGTHIVAKGYGGGGLVGSIVGTNVKRVYDSHQTIEETMESILEFGNFSVSSLEKPSYGLFGGEVEGDANLQIRQLYDLREAQRSEILREWESSLKVNFEMLNNELTLERISVVVREKLGEEKGDMVDQAIGILLRGELKRKRRTSGATRSVSSTTKPSPAAAVTAITAPTSVTTTTKATTTSKSTTTSTTTPFTSDLSREDGGYSTTTTSTPPSDSNWSGRDGLAHNSERVGDIRSRNFGSTIQEQTKHDWNITQSMINDIERSIVEANIAHRARLNELEIKQRLAKLMEERCGGTKKINPECWTDALYEKTYPKIRDVAKIKLDQWIRDKNDPNLKWKFAP